MAMITAVSTKAYSDGFCYSWYGICTGFVVIWAFCTLVGSMMEYDHLKCDAAQEPCPVLAALDPFPYSFGQDHADFPSPLVPLTRG